MNGHITILQVQFNSAAAGIARRTGPADAGNGSGEYSRAGPYREGRDGPEVREVPKTRSQKREVTPKLQASSA